MWLAAENADDLQARAAIVSSSAGLEASELDTANLVVCHCRASLRSVLDPVKVATYVGGLRRRHYNGYVRHSVLVIVNRAHLRASNKQCDCQENRKEDKPGIRPNQIEPAAGRKTLLPFWNLAGNTSSQM